jgi:hypothetical protein
MNIKLEGWLYAQPNEFSPANPKISFWEGKETKFWVSQGYVPLCEYTIEVEAPDVDIVSGQVQCLLAKRQKMTEEFTKAAARIDDALAQLKCLTFNDKGVVA